MLIDVSTRTYDRRFYAAERRFYLAVEPALRSLLSIPNLNCAQTSRGGYTSSESQAASLLRLRSDHWHPAARSWRFIDNSQSNRTASAMLFVRRSEMECRTAR
jgi:hypothetical protein